MKQYDAITGILLVMASCVSAGYVPIGDYVQDTYAGEEYSNLFNSSLGWRFDGSMEYESGDYYRYSWSASGVSKIASDLPLGGTYSNMQRLLFYSEPAFGNPAHGMTERITVNSSRLWYYEPGSYSKCSSTLKLEVPKNSVTYQVDAGYIPLRYITDSTSMGCDGYYSCYADLEYRGQIPFLGEGYYVKDVSSDDRGWIIYLDRGSALNITDTGYDAGYNGYAFKLNRTVTPESSPKYLVLDVRKPDGTINQVSASNNANAVLDGVEIAAINAGTDGPVQTASIIVYNRSSEAVLKDGEYLEINGKTVDNWEVRLATADSCDSEYASDGTQNDCDITAYDNMDYAEGSLLKRITIKNTHDLSGYGALAVNESLEFPGTYKLTFKGFLNEEYKEVSCTSSEQVYATYYIGTTEEETTTTSSTTTTTTTPTTSTTSTTTSTSSSTTTLQTCDLPGDYPPCGTISLSEVVDRINKWANDEAGLQEVIDLINEWAGT